MEILTLLGQLFKLSILILSEYYDRRAEARAADKKYKLDMENFQKLVDASVVKLRKQVASDSQQAGTMDDVMDEEIRRRNTTDSTQGGHE